MPKNERTYEVGDIIQTDIISGKITGMNLDESYVEISQRVDVRDLNGEFEADKYELRLALRDRSNND